VIKDLKKLGIKGTFFNTSQDILHKPIVNIIHNGKKIGTIFSKIKNEARVSTLPTLIQHNAKLSNQSNKTGERNARDSNREGEVKLPLFAESMILYLKDPKNVTNS
jgi:hypothetical protein